MLEDDSDYLSDQYESNDEEGNTNPHSNDAQPASRHYRAFSIEAPGLYGELEMLKNPVRDAYCQCAKKRQGRELFCKCGEDDQFFEWVWDLDSKSSSCDLYNDQRVVRFHSGFSAGTAAVRSNKPMTNRQYFWEIKMITPVYGTDMMVGIGTERVDPNSASNSFRSFLGLDTESWGLSCYGNIQHNNHITSHQWARFGQGSIIGFHLDTWLGHLHLYKNRIHLGVIFRKLRGKHLYAMAASTAARTGMRLVRSVSHPTNLVFLCCCVLRKYVPLQHHLLNVLSFPPGLKEFLRNNLAWLIAADTLDESPLVACRRSRKHSLANDDDDLKESKRIRRNSSPNLVENDSSESEAQES